MLMYFIQASQEAHQECQNLNLPTTASENNQIIGLEATTRTRTLRKYCCKKATPAHWKNIREHGILTDHLHDDHRHIASRMAEAPLPAFVDLRFGFPTPFDQGQLGSCTANATVAVAMYEIMRDTQRSCDMLSRLFLYYDSRALEGTIHEDAGANLVDVITSLHNKGVCKEMLWPYSDNTIRFKIKPTPSCYTQGLKCRDLDPEHTASVAQNLNTMRTILAYGCPIIAGINLYESFESDEVARTGIVPMPDPSTERCLGGHAVVIVGYNDNSWLMRNSWGTNWGMHGYFALPLNYLLNPDLADDFLKIGRMTTPSHRATFANVAFASSRLLSQPARSNGTQTLTTVQSSGACSLPARRERINDFSDDEAAV